MFFYRSLLKKIHWAKHEFSFLIKKSAFWWSVTYLIFIPKTFTVQTIWFELRKLTHLQGKSLSRKEYLHLAVSTVETWSKVINVGQLFFICKLFPCFVNNSTMYLHQRRKKKKILFTNTKNIILIMDKAIVGPPLFPLSVRSN